LPDRSAELFTPNSPSGPDWLHEIKHDGFRMPARRDAKLTLRFKRSGQDSRHSKEEAHVVPMPIRLCPYANLPVH
jgi:hypothetical protein